jgi:hypothetical protein
MTIRNQHQPEVFHLLTPVQSLPLLAPGNQPRTSRKRTACSFGLLII